MDKVIALMTAVVFASMMLSPMVFAQDQKKEQIHKGTSEAGTVQKKEQKKDKKKAPDAGASKDDKAKQ